MKLGENEKVIRTYRIRDGQATGKAVTEELSVTTSRLIHTVSTKSATQSSVSNVQLNIDSVMDMSYGTSFTILLWKIIFGSLLCLAGLIFFIMSFVSIKSTGKVSVGNLIIGLLLIAGGVTLIIFGAKKKPRAYITIYAKLGQKAMSFSSGQKNKYKIQLISSNPSPALYQCIDELPAIITDINDIGEAAFDKWGRG